MSSVIVKTKQQIDGIINILTKCTILDFFNSPIINNKKLIWENFQGFADIPRHVPYDETYNAIVRSKNFNMLMVDGSIIQMYYEFQGKQVNLHRLAFLPSPMLFCYEEISELYQQDAIYLDMIARDIVHVPLRFDFDVSKRYHKNVVHAKSHLHIGQYKNCRIPVSAPLTPNMFMDFILRNFYAAAYIGNKTIQMLNISNIFEETITEQEKQIIHLNIF